MKKWQTSNEGKLQRLKTVGRACGWTFLYQTDIEMKMLKHVSNNRHVDIEGDMEFLYNADEHSVTTTLKHHEKVKILKRYINKACWKPVELILKYPRIHLGDINIDFEYIKNK
jgi:hypothetical protein